MIENREQAQQPTRRALRGFGLAVAVITLALFGLLLPWLRGHVSPRWPWVVAVLLCTWALLLPASLAPVHRGWLAAGRALGWINTRVVLAVVFYSLFVPAGLIMRALNKDPMARRMDESRDSYRVVRARRVKDHMERPY